MSDVNVDELKSGILNKVLDNGLESFVSTDGGSIKVMKVDKVTVKELTPTDAEIKVYEFNEDKCVQYLKTV